MKTNTYALYGSILWSVCSFANDSSIGLDSGNISFKKSDGIAMLSEDLYISPKEVRVRYEFKNQTKTDIKTLVGFPIPPINISFSDTNFNRTSDNPLNFKTWIDGQEIPVNIHRQQQGSDENDDYQLEYTYTWEQVFPANKTLIVEHHYQTSPTVVVATQYMGVETYDSDSTKYCLAESVSPRLSQSKKLWSPYYVNYILTTANNWQGAIGDFRLVIDKEKPDTIVSLCAKGIHKINATQFEMRQKNFKPSSDLAILFLQRND
jgi:hypothetical protein